MYVLNIKVRSNI